MKFFKENWWKLVLMLCGIVVAYAFYNAFVIVPKQQAIIAEQNNLLSKQEDCRKIGSDYFEKFEKGIDKDSFTRTAVSPIYWYNEEESNCLIETGTITYLPGSTLTYKFIVNLKTNATMAEIFMDSKNVSIQEQEDYSNKKSELFGLLELPKK